MAITERLAHIRLLNDSLKKRIYFLISNLVFDDATVLLILFCKCYFATTRRDFLACLFCSFFLSQWEEEEVNEWLKERKTEEEARQ